MPKCSTSVIFSGKNCKGMSKYILFPSTNKIKISQISLKLFLFRKSMRMKSLSFAIGYATYKHMYVTIHLLYNN